MSYPITTGVTQTRAVIKPIIESAWASLGYDVETIEWPNQLFYRPEVGPWLRVSYTDQSTTQFTWGGIGVVQNEALVLLSLQIFAPRNVGEDPLNTISDTLRGTFERKAFGAGIYFRECRGPTRTEEPTWSGALVQLPFTYIEEVTL